MHDMREGLVHMFSSSKSKNINYVNTDAGKEFKKKIVVDGHFWEVISYALHTIIPLVNILQLAKSKKMSDTRFFFYGAIEKTKKEIMKILNDEYSSYSEMIKKNKRWKFNMHHDLHVAAYF